MFEIVRNWLYRRRMRQRQIFVYDDGQKVTAIDPLVAWPQVWEHPEFDLRAEGGAATGQHVDTDDGGRQVVTEIEIDLDAQARLCVMVRDVFGVEQFDPATGRGLTRSELIQLLCRFLAYVDNLKKTRDPSPIASQHSAGTSSSDGSGETPESGPDSSSTASESTAAAG